MDQSAEPCYHAARTLMQRCRDQFGAAALPAEVSQVQDLLECIEKNADRVAHMMKQRKRSSAKWDDIKALLTEQDRYFKEIIGLFVQMSKKKLVVRSAAAP